MKKIILLPALFLSVYLMETLAETSYAARYFETMLRQQKTSQIQNQNGRYRVFPVEGFRLLENDSRLEFVRGSVPKGMDPVNRTPLENRVDAAAKEMKDTYYKWMFFRLFLWFILIMMVTIIYHSIISFTQSFGRNKNAALEILKSRYAWGGITRDEYFIMKKELEWRAGKTRAAARIDERSSHVHVSV
jgi:hypothetical protein